MSAWKTRVYAQHRSRIAREVEEAHGGRGEWEGWGRCVVVVYLILMMCVGCRSSVECGCTDHHKRCKFLLPQCSINAQSDDHPILHLSTQPVHPSSPVGFHHAVALPNLDATVHEVEADPQ